MYRINDEKENTAALNAIEKLMDIDPPADSFLGGILKSLTAAVQEYEAPPRKI